MRKPALVLCVVLSGVWLVPLAVAEMPYSANPAPAEPYAYADWLFINTNGDLPSSFDVEDTWWLTDFRGDDLLVVYNPQELYGVRGMGANRAWQVSTGRPDVTIAILDSGMLWHTDRECGLLRKLWLNRGELPMPSGGPNPDDTRFGGYDVSHDGVFNVEDYWDDPAVVDVNGNSWIDPEDLILLFSDGVDDDGNGYTDDISGWDFYEHDNDPRDDVEHGHGSHQAGHAAAEAPVNDEGCPADPEAPFGQRPGTCPNCMVMPLRVGDSFIADVNHFAEAVIYAVDNGARVVEDALGTLNHTSFGQAAVDYAYSHGVIVNASAADEAAGHHNWPAAYEHTVVHNSIRPPSLELTTPHSYLYLNGCTNFGAYINISVPSTSCSSQATGLAAGLSGLLVSGALNAIDRGDMSAYVADDGTTASYPLSVAEIEQLWRLAADDIDFSTDYPDHAFSDLWPQYRPWWWIDDTPDGSTNNYGLELALVSTRRYQTVRGWDFFTGYGRINAARLLRSIGIEADDGSSRELVPGQGPYAVGHDPLLSAQDRIPPEAEMSWPRRWQQYGHDAAFRLLLPDDPSHPDQVVVQGRVAANRVTSAGGSFDYILEWAPGAQGAPAPVGLGQAAPGSEERSAGPWTVAHRVDGLTSAYTGELARIPVAELAAAVAANPDPFALEGDPTGPRQTERWAVRLRVRVIAHPVNPDDEVYNEAVQQKQVDVYPAAEQVLRNDLGAHGQCAGGSASPSFHDIDGDGHDELLVPTDDGLIHAFTDVASGAELPGWPVTASILPALPSDGDNAFTRGDVPDDARSSFFFGTAAVGDLDGSGRSQVVMGDADGRVYAWEADGSLREGFPVTVDYELSAETPCGPDTIPECDDLDPVDRRNPMNQRDWAIMSAPAIGDLDPDRPGLEIVAACADSHLYAWSADGEPVPGWPVVLRDPLKVESMDETTHVWRYSESSQWDRGSKATITPSLGDLDGDGDLEVVAVVNEEYHDIPNADFHDRTLELLLDLTGDAGNSRVYALHHTGDRSPVSPASLLTPHTQDQAYVDGWPVAMATAGVDLLPTAGQGSNAQPALADIDHDGTLEVMAASHLGPGYVLDHEGGPYLGWDNGVYRTLDTNGSTFGPDSLAEDEPSMVALGGLAVGALGADGTLSVAAASAGVTRMIDVLLPARQGDGEDQLGIWNPATGDFRDNAPLVVNDFQFFGAPIVADVDGDGAPEVLQQTAYSDLVAVGASDQQPNLVVRHTGGWHMGSAAVGLDPSSDGGSSDPLVIASLTREGFLRVFATDTPATGEIAGRALGQWPEAGHDPHNSGNLLHDAVPPYPITGLEVEQRGGGALLTFIATGDDRRWGVADHYEVRQLDDPAAVPEWWDAAPVEIDPASPTPPGQADSITIRFLSPGVHRLLVRAFDESGNGSTPVSVTITVVHQRPGGTGRVQP